MAKRKNTKTAADAMRQVMAGGAKETADIVAAVKSQFGIDVSTNYASQFKSVNKKRRGGRGREKVVVKTRTRKATKASANGAILAGVEFIKQAGSIRCRNMLNQVSINAWYASIAPS